jgi:hypothetical protein
MNPTQLFIAEKTKLAILALERARVRAPHESTLLALALVVGRVQVNHLVKPVPSVRAAMFRLREESARRAAQLAAELVSRYEAEADSPQRSQELQEALRACCGVFPREAAVLRRALRADQVDDDAAEPVTPED